MIRVFFGNPGCGKTTSACSFLKRSHNRYDYSFCNFSVSDNIARQVDLSDLGLWTFPPNSYICVDEAGIQYNNRKYKTLPQYTIEWFKLHRHARCDVDFFSQSWEDMDITIRRLADELWYMCKVGPFTFSRRIYKRVAVDDNTHQIIDGYRFSKLLTALIPFYGSNKLVFRPSWYKYFDSWEMPDLPVRFADKDTSGKVGFFSYPFFRGLGRSLIALLKSWKPRFQLFNGLSALRRTPREDDTGGRQNPSADDSR